MANLAVITFEAEPKELINGLLTNIQSKSKGWITSEAGVAMTTSGWDMVASS